jgi:hypothetical protein
MTILMTVMGGLTALMVSGTQAQAEVSRRFEAQGEGRLALDLLRRDVHCASASSVASPAATVTLTVTGCSFAVGNSTTWCTVANGTGRYGLWRYDSATCSGSGRKIADYLTTANAFTYNPASGSAAAGTGKLASMGIVLDVNLTPGNPERVYALHDTVVFRNSSRPV